MNKTIKGMALSNRTINVINQMSFDPFSYNIVKEYFEFFKVDFLRFKSRALLDRVEITFV